MTKKIEIPDIIRSVTEKLKNAGYEAYIVGGCVRDSLMGIPPHDYDITTDASPDEMKDVFSDCNLIETGLKHGTLTAMSDGSAVEVTTYRIDGNYNDNRHPDSVTFTKSLKEDLARRDFTINAMAYSDDGMLIDLFGGRDDLAAGTIRCVGNPEKRFGEDALRIIRALRFASVLGFELEESTKKAVFALKDRLISVSAERLAAELEKLIMGNNCFSVLTEYSEVLSVFIPEISPCVDFDQHNRYHRYTVWEHIAMAVATSRRERHIRLAMLFHDIGKPLCYTFDEVKEQGHFHGHEKISAEMADVIMRRLKMSTETVNTVCKLIEKHYFKPQVDSNGNPVPKNVRKMLSELGGDMFFMLLDVQRADANSKQGFCLDRLPILDKMEAAAKEMLAEGDCLTLKDLDVDGNDLIASGYSGKQIGEALSYLLDKVVSEELPNKKDILLADLTKNK